MDSLGQFKTSYIAALEEYLHKPKEEGLETAYQLGREAMKGQLSSLDIARIHHEALADVVVAGVTANVGSEEIRRLLARATTFRIESLSTFEIAQRGYFEAQQLYQRERDVAETLRQSLLPEMLPTIPGAEIEAFYRPGGLGNSVGGDFYDVVENGLGGWDVLLGDVCGKGAAAAAVTAMARHTARAGIVQGRGPAGALQMVNQVFLTYGQPYFCTLVHARVERAATGMRITFATGGHPPPLLIEAEGQASFLSCAGPLLGVIPDLEISELTVDFAPGETVIFYSDGVTEARLPDGFLGERGLLSLVEACAGFDASKIVASITNGLDNVEESARRDDVAILALKVTG